MGLLVTNTSELIRDVQTGGSLGYGVEFAILRDMGQVGSKVMNFRKTNFQLFKATVNRILWEAACRYTGAQWSWKIFKKVFHGGQHLAIPGVRSRARKARNQHGRVGNSWSN